MESNTPHCGTATIPSELTGPLPRKVRSSPDGVRSAFIAAAVVAIALAGTSWVAMRGVHQFQYQAALRSDGLEATAQITGFSHAGKHGGILVTYYSFAVSGTAFTGNAHVPKQLEQAIHESSTLPIVYLPTNPAVNHPAAWEEPAINAIVPLLSPLIPVGVGVMMLASGRRERRLLAEGLPAIATITKSYPLSKGGYQSDYEFRTQDGSVGTGNNSFDGPPEIGTSFCVIYLPQNPRRNLPYPLLDYRIVE